MGDEENLRIGDAERDAAVTLLREHMSAGRLTPEEFDERMSAALTAKTRGELAILFKDLPDDGTDDPYGVSGLPAQPATPQVPTRQRPWFTPVLLVAAILVVLAFIRPWAVMLIPVIVLALILSKTSRSQVAQRSPVSLQQPERDELVALVRQGQKIRAIKRYREMTGADLVNAKNAIDALHGELGG